MPATASELYQDIGISLLKPTDDFLVRRQAFAAVAGAGAEDNLRTFRNRLRCSRLWLSRSGLCRPREDRRTSGQQGEPPAGSTAATASLACFSQLTLLTMNGTLGPLYTIS